jgi:DNA polymerase I-like protein with 3'-5' exonuclease and polymerase domains
MLLPPGKQFLFDIETTGLLPYLTEHRGDDVKSRIHILAIRDLETGQTQVFRKNKRQDSIARGVKLLAEADVLVGHNIIGFDIPVIELLYPEYQCNALVRDTLVLSRVFFADEKERDFRRHKRGELEGKEIGRHGLEAWGQRLGMHKGDYSKTQAEHYKALYPHLPKEEIIRLVWSEWNQEMEDYCVQDLNVNEALWRLMVANPRRHSDQSITLEHRVHALMEEVTNNGFPFDEAAARALEDELRLAVEEKEAKAIAHFGSWWVPSKWKTIGKEYTSEIVDPETGKPLLDDEGKVKKTKVSFAPRRAYGEDNSRGNWGEITVPKKTMRFKPETNKPDKIAGCAYVPVELKEFNPGSRPQIVDRLTKIYDWEPQEFTEAGAPAVNDEVLRDLAHTVPICDELAELFYYNKRLGQLVDGKNGWIGKAQERGDGRIHASFNVGGTVTNRASHANPNIAQVPRVVFKKLKQWLEPEVTIDFKQGKIVYGIWRDGPDGERVFDSENITPLLDPLTGKQLEGVPAKVKTNEPLRDADGVLFPSYTDEDGNEVQIIEIEGREGVFKVEEGKVATKKQMLKGRCGDHGWNARNLFIVPDGWVLMGADQKGIELRALGHFMAEFDDGVYAKLVVDSDPHDLHTAALELNNRDTAKTFIYALIYGAQDFKLGTVIDPALALKPTQAKAVGAEMRRRLMTRIPALGMVVKNVQRQSKSGMLDALDGRKLFVRAQHAALNTMLQGAGATIAKQWCVNFHEYCLEDGLVHGWDGDFAIVAWIHDELQVAVKDDPRVREICERNIVAAAYDAGMMFGFRCPVDVDVKFGRRWSETH